MKVGSRNFDVIVIGAGPAGLSAGMWCSELGLSTIMLEQESRAGGQLHSIYNPITNYLGLEARNGNDLCSRFLDMFEKFQVPVVYNSRITHIKVKDHSVTVESEDRYVAAFLIVASGVSRRRLDVPWEDQFAEKGILVSGARDRVSADGKVVAVVGGGDAALENALLLSEFAARVYVVHRRGEFRARARLVELAAANSKIEFLLGSQITSIDGRDAVEAVTVRHGDGKSVKLAVDMVLVRIGVVPNSGLLLGKTLLDPNGYVMVDPVGRTSNDRIYAVGDVACPTSPTIATAAGMGAAAAKHIRFLLDDGVAV